MDNYHGSIKVVETNRVSALTAASTWLKVKKFAALLGASVFFGGIMYGIGYGLEWTKLEWAGMGVAGIGLLMGVYTGLTAKVSKCPCCGGDLGKSAFDTISKGDENEQIECGHCHEWLLSNGGNVRPYTVEDALGKNKQEFDAPVFQHLMWANECVVCGNPPTQFREVKGRKWNAEQLLIGSVSVSSSSVSGVPYCDLHVDMMKLKIKDEYPRLVFPSYPAQRRYLAVNYDQRGKVLKEK